MKINLYPHYGNVGKFFSVLRFSGLLISQLYLNDLIRYYWTTKEVAVSLFSKSFWYLAPKGPLFLGGLKSCPSILWLLEVSDAKENKVDEGKHFIISSNGVLPFSSWRKHKYWPEKCMFCSLGLHWHIPSCYCQSFKYVCRQFLSPFSFLETREVILVYQIGVWDSFPELCQLFTMASLVLYLFRRPSPPLYV